MKTICAWCGHVLHMGADDAPVSHGICSACAKNLLMQASPGRLA